MRIETRDPDTICGTCAAVLGPGGSFTICPDCYYAFCSDECKRVHVCDGEEIDP